MERDCRTDILDSFEPLSVRNEAFYSLSWFNLFHATGKFGTESLCFYYHTADGNIQRCKGFLLDLIDMMVEFSMEMA